MRALILTALVAGLACPALARVETEEYGLSEAAITTDTVKNGDEEEDQALIQETDEDLADFVTDYIKKDIQLKGAFYLEDKAAGTVQKLKLAEVRKKTSAAEGGAKKLEATLKDAAGKKFTVIFYLHNAPWGGLDIFKIELKSPPVKAGGAKK